MKDSQEEEARAAGAVTAARRFKYAFKSAQTIVIMAKYEQSERKFGWQDRSLSFSLLKEGNNHEHIFEEGVFPSLADPFFGTLSTNWLTN